MRSTKKVRMARKMLFKFAILSFCAFGCLYQVIDVLTNYFKYESVTEVSVEITEVFRIPQFSLCFKLSTIFDHKGFQRKHPNITLKYADTFDSNDNLAEIYEQATLEDIFDFTPRAEDLVVDCQKRTPSGYDMKGFDKAGCYDLLTFAKFYVQQFVCYKLEVKKEYNSILLFRRVGNTLSHMGMLYSVTINETAFAGANIMKFHFSRNHGNVYPDPSAAFASIVSRELDKKTKRPNNNLFTESFYTVVSNSLPPPHKDCFDYQQVGLQDRRQCYKECFAVTAQKQLNLHPFVSIEVKPSAYKIVGFNALRNATALQIFEDIENDCQSMCSRQDCYELHFFTEDKAVQYDLFIVNIVLPRSPSYKLTTRPKYLVTEVMIYLLSTFGTWFGISVFGTVLKARKMHRLVTPNRIILKGGKAPRRKDYIRSSLLQSFQIENLQKAFLDMKAEVNHMKQKVGTK